VFLDFDKISIFAEFAQVEVAHWNAELGQADKFFAVETGRVSKHSTAIDDSNRLVRAKKDFI
jgi:hypothetical protein